jgi:creatinine amidohydrolase
MTSNAKLSRLLGDLATPDVNTNVTADAIIVPIGAIEAHGPHLPLSTDLDIATHAVSALLAEVGEELNLWGLPPIAFSKSNEHAWAPGTVWLSATTMLAMFDDIGRSLAKLATRKVLFVNAHGGNSALLQVICRDLRLAYGLQTFLAHPFTSTNEGNELGMGIHGGHDETSMLLHIRPDLVDLTKAVRAVPEHLAQNQQVKWGGSVSFGWLSHDFEPEPPAGQLPVGIIGDGTNASAEHGEKLWAKVLNNLVQACREIAVFGNRVLK